MEEELKMFPLPLIDKFEYHDSICKLDRRKGVVAGRTFGILKSVDVRNKYRR